MTTVSVEVPNTQQPWGLKPKIKGDGEVNISPRFVLAGRAYFTVINKKGDRKTYKITRADDCSDGELRWFAGVLTEPDNLSGYTYIGMMDPKSLKVALTKKSNYGREDSVVKILQWALDVIMERATIPEGYSIVHAGKCARCGRQLTTPESISTGLGPKCAELWQVPWGRAVEEGAEEISEMWDDQVRWQDNQTLDQGAGCDWKGRP